MSWIPVIAWLVAVVLAVVVLGFCAYEITWKARRLRADLQHLQDLSPQLAQLQGDVAATRQRLARSGVR